MTENKLLPCPFCGGEVKIRHISEPARIFMGACWTTTNRISCDKCNLDMSMVDKDVATQKWNTRATVTTSEVHTDYTHPENVHKKPDNLYTSPLAAPETADQCTKSDLLHSGRTQTLADEAVTLEDLLDEFIALRKQTSQGTWRYYYETLEGNISKVSFINCDDGVVCRIKNDVSGRPLTGVDVANGNFIALAVRVADYLTNHRAALQQPDDGDMVRKLEKAIIGYEDEWPINDLIGNIKTIIDEHKAKVQR